MTAVSLEYGVFAHADFNVQIACRAAVAARFALAGQANAIAGVDARGNLHGERLLLANAALPITSVAGIGNDFAAALAAWAGLLNGEYRLLYPDLALTAAGIAGLGRGALGGARALAGLAFHQRRNLNLGVGAEHRFLQIQFEFVAQIRAAKYLGAAALPAGEYVAEHLAENVAEGIAGTESAAAAPLQARMAELIVDGALLRVAEHLVGLLALLESMLGFRIVGIAIRMIFHGEAPVRLLDLGFRCVSRQLEELVVILLRHCSPN